MSRGRRISRVKLVPPAPAIAEKYLREWSNKALYHTPEKFPELSKPGLFNKPGTLELEIGCGTGEFLNAKAEENPHIFYVGIDISRRAIYHAVNHAGNSKLENVLFIKADAKLTYPLLAPTSLDIIYLNFPDPNYGNRNLKHRIFTPQFLDVMHPALTQNGKILVVTDQQPFLMDMLEIAENDDRYIKLHEERYLTTFSPITKTRFQKAWERFKRPTFRFELKKV
jgi:tRNA (guanine-N7-)-methyltransferase